jgi:hypothetical protein
VIVNKLFIIALIYPFLFRPQNALRLQKIKYSYGSKKTEEVCIDMLVTNQGKPMTDLQEADLEVFDNGVQQEIEYLGFRQTPIDSILVLDMSASTVPHIAFEVDNLDAALVGLTLLGEISSPSEGVRVAMIVDNVVPVELIEFQKPLKS